MDDGTHGDPKGKEVKQEVKQGTVTSLDFAPLWTTTTPATVTVNAEIKMERPSAAIKRGAEAEAAAAAATIPSTTAVIEAAVIARRKERIRYNAERNRLNPKAVAAPKGGVFGTKGGMSSTAVFTVLTQVPAKENDPAIQAMCGDYAECGDNHGRKTYIRKTYTRVGNMTYIYYWDQRGGVDYCGRWFGQCVGAMSPLARCVSQSETPPDEGWKVPWDSASTMAGLLVIDWSDQ